MTFRFPLLFLLLTSFGTATVSAQKNLPVDVLESTVVWSASKVGGSHTGNVSLDSGTLTMQNGVLLLADVTMKMESITCSDLSNPSSNQKLVSHLKSEDFFHVGIHPKAQFRTTSVEQKEPVGEKNTYRVVGILTIKGIEAPNSTYGAKAITTGPLEPFASTVPCTGSNMAVDPSLRDWATA